MYIYKHMYIIRLLFNMIYIFVLDIPTYLLLYDIHTGLKIYLLEILLEHMLASCPFILRIH